MSSDIGKRLKQVRMDAGFKSAGDAAARFGWNANTYRSHENASRGVTRNALLNYAKAFKVEVSWLMTGAQGISPAAVAEGVTSVPVAEWSDLPAEWGRVTVQSLRSKASRNIVFSGSLPAKEVIALVIRDDAMIGSIPSRHTLFPGDIIVVAAHTKIPPGRPIVIWDAQAGEHVVRCAEYKTRTIIHAKALNAAHPTITLPVNSPHILGVVVGVTRAL